MQNRIYFGDNLPILRRLPTESVDLIYIDPPFNTKKVQKRTTLKTLRDENGDRKGFGGKSYRTIQLGTQAFQDSFESYVDDFLRPRLLEAKRILKPYGSLYFHIDYREVHYCKIMLDEVFGRDSFLNEIIWAYDYGGRPKTKWPAKHDNILFYAKNPKQYLFNVLEIDREDYMAPGLVGPEKAKRKKLPTDTWWPAYVGADGSASPPPMGWMHVARNTSHTDVWFASKGRPQGHNDVWWQTIVPTASREKTGYPTQKPRRLIDRIIKASSLQGNTVLDFFAGSGTVGESCLHLNRQFILIDNNRPALEVMARRLPRAANIEWINFDPRPFQPRAHRAEVKASNADGAPSNAEFVMLAAMANYLQKDLEDDTGTWNNSPFEWILRLPPRSKGKLGGDLVGAWLLSKGTPFKKSGDSSEMLVINGVRFSVKFSTLWANGSYRFQQIRGSGYDYVICLGISPFNAHCWIMDRKYAISKAKPQHRGSRTADYWIAVNPAQPPEWSDGHGGTLEQAYLELRRVLRIR